MAVTSSGQITLQNIQDEFGGSHPISISEYYGKDTVPSSGQISLADFYGTQNAFAFTVSTKYTTPQNVQTVALAAGWDGVKPIIMTIASSNGFHSNTTGTEALNVNVANTTIINNGWIAGRGGTAYGGAGGKALNISATGVIVQNNSGAFIAGGGGGGGGQGGGGGAGMSTIGSASSNASTTGCQGVGNCSFAHSGCCSICGTVQGGTGGNQGGGGVASGNTGFCGSCISNYGHQISGCGSAPNNPAQGGSVLDANSNTDGSGSNGGGGWGRPGENGGGAGGKAVEDNGNSYTLTNNGTIYGGTT